MSWKSESESFLTWTYKYTRNRKRHSVYQLGEFSSVKKQKQASQELDRLLVIKRLALQDVKKKKKVSNLGGSFSASKLSGLGMV